jgi:hypothetical protein
MLLRITLHQDICATTSVVTRGYHSAALVSACTLTQQRCQRRAACQGYVKFHAVSSLHTSVMCAGDVLDSEGGSVEDSDGEMGGSEGRRHPMEVEDESIHSFEGHSGVLRWRWGAPRSSHCYDRVVAVSDAVMATSCISSNSARHLGCFMPSATG